MNRNERRELDAGIDAALEFLLTARDEEGWWHDFRLYPGISDEWVSAYVATILASIPEPRCTEAARATWRLLTTRQRPDGRWGYSWVTIGDGDSTAWGIRLAYALGMERSDHAHKALQVLAEHLRPSGSVATYATDGPIRRLIEAPDEMSFRGWCGAHPCVTAVVAAIPEYCIPTCSYLSEMQSDDGSWRSYWWFDHEYATALAAEALARGGDPDGFARAARATQWALRRLQSRSYIATSDHPGGSPFATAWCLRLLLLADDPASVREPIEAVTAWLLQQQRADGSWSPSARLRVPWPDEDQPDVLSRGWIYGGRKEGAVTFDQHGIFTTATVLAALQRARERQGA